MSKSAVSIELCISHLKNVVTPMDSSRSLRTHPNRFRTHSLRGSRVLLSVFIVRCTALCCDKMAKPRGYKESKIYENAIHNFDHVTGKHTVCSQNEDYSIYILEKSFVFRAKTAIQAI